MMLDPATVELQKIDFDRFARTKDVEGARAAAIEWMGTLDWDNKVEGFIREVNKKNKVSDIAVFMWNIDLKGLALKKTIQAAKVRKSENE